MLRTFFFAYHRDCGQCAHVHKHAPPPEMQDSGQVASSPRSTSPALGSAPTKHSGLPLRAVPGSSSVPLSVVPARSALLNDYCERRTLIRLIHPSSNRPSKIHFSSLRCPFLLNYSASRVALRVADLMCELLPVIRSLLLSQSRVRFRWRSVRPDVYTL